MKRRPKRRRRPVKVIHLWNFPQAQKALPYLRSVVGSLRDHWLHVQGVTADMSRQAKAPGRPDRHTLIVQESTREEKEEAETQFTDALQELMKLDVYLLDPVRGLALIPFAQNEQLAWFVFDQFDPQGVSSWRFHEDALDIRRPLGEAQLEVPPSPTAA